MTRCWKFCGSHGATPDRWHKMFPVQVQLAFNFEHPLGSIRHMYIIPFNLSLSPSILLWPSRYTSCFLHLMWPCISRASSLVVASGAVKTKSAIRVELADQGVASKAECDARDRLQYWIGTQTRIESCLTQVQCLNNTISRSFRSSVRD